MTRTEVLGQLGAALQVSKKTLGSQFGPVAFSAATLQGQIALLSAVAYLVEHAAEQAWRNYDSVQKPENVT
jgi:hypothetical protein